MLVFSSSNFMSDFSLQNSSITIRKTSNKGRILVISILLILLVIFAISLVRYLGSQKKSSPPVTSQSETPSPTPTVEPSPTSSVSKKDLTITVQNGSGELGVAKSGSDFLKGLGYDVSSSGNADKFDYKGVTIQIKADKKSFLATLKKDLSSKYTVSSESADLDSSFSTDALVIIGK